MHMSLFPIIFLFEDTFLVWLNELLHPFRKETLWFYTKILLYCLLNSRTNFMIPQVIMVPHVIMVPQVIMVPSHYSLWLVQIHRLCTWLAPLMLTRFVGHSWLKHLPCRCVLSCTMLMGDQIGFRCSSLFKTFFLLIYFSLVPGVYSM